MVIMAGTPNDADAEAGVTSQLSTFWESPITLICMQIVKEEEE